MASNNAASGVPAADATGHWAVYPGDISAQGLSGPITAGKCEYRQATDGVHDKTGRDKNQVSVHGWWEKYSGTCPSKATVTTYLEAYWCSTVSGCEWITLDSNGKDVYEGGGGSNWSNARTTCVNFDVKVSFRGYVDVDLDGVEDPPGYTYSAKENFYCDPPPVG
jgi:hypothetical protein